MQSTIGKHIFALLSMVGGGFMVFSTVMYMNQQEKPPKEAPEASQVEFKVEKKPPKKKKKAKRKQPQKQRQSRSAPAPRTPNLSSAISGVEVEFSGLGGFAMEGVSNDLIGSFDKKGPMTEGALDNPPKIMSKGGRLDYPDTARKKGIEGYVTLNLYIRGDGSVGSVKVLDSKPSGVFEEPAKAYVREWTFTPGTYEGEAVDAWVKQRIRFQLQKS